MSELPASIIPPAELDYHVQSLRPQHVADIGTASWLSAHQTILKLLQQANLEMRTHQEETVKDQIVQHGKLPILVHETYVVLVWRTKVLPRLLAIEAQLTATFALYTVLFHEATALSLIEAVLFHQNGCEALNETCVDLIDYCAQALAQLIGLVAKWEDDDGGDEKPTENVADELARQQCDILYKIGMRCVSVLCYIVDKLDALSPSASARLVRTHDMPCVLSAVLHCRPWQRRQRRTGVYEKFADDRWQHTAGDELLRVTKVEAQTWLCLRQLLFSGAAMRGYAITDFRQRELAKCAGLMNDVLLDQLPPLVELKHYLCTLQVTQSSGGETLGKQVLLEELPQVRERIVGWVKRTGGWDAVVEQQAEVFLHKSAVEVQEMASRLNETYAADVWEHLEKKRAEESPQSVEERECLKCQQTAVKKCYRCKAAFYCCRKCQVEDWPRHKLGCIPL